DHIIDVLHFGHQLFPAGTRRYRYVNDIYIAKTLPDHVIQLDKPFIHFLSFLTLRKIVVAAIDHHLPRVIGIDDVLRIPDQVIEGRPAETTVDDRIAGKVCLYAGPFAERAAADEQDGIGGRMLKTVLMLEFGDLIPERRLC